MAPEAKNCRVDPHETWVVSISSFKLGNTRQAVACKLFSDNELSAMANLWTSWFLLVSFVHLLPSSVSQQFFQDPPCDAPADLAIDGGVGAAASKVDWSDVYNLPPREGEVEIIEADSAAEQAELLVDKLFEEKVI